MTAGPEERAARRVLDLMDFGARPAEAGIASTPPIALAYEHCFNARFQRAIEVARRPGAVGPGDRYAAAVRDQIEALCAVEPRESARLDAIDPSTLEGAMTVFHASEAAHVRGDLDGCRAMLEAALDAGVPDRRPRTWLRMALARSQVFRGEIAQAEAELDRAEDDASTPLSIQAARCMRVLLAGVRGDRPAVVRIAEAMRAEIVAPRTYADAGLALLGAMGLGLCGLPRAASELLHYGAGGPGLPLLPPALRAYGFDLLVESALGTGKPDLAAWIMLEFDRINLAGNAQMIAARETSRARLSIAAGERDRGVARADAAGRAAMDTGSRLVAARAALAAAAGRDGDVDDLVAAVSSEDLRGWMVRSLAATGRRPRPLPAIGWEQLTPPQEAVARLAARGLRNQEIAELLVLSPRTVEGHIAAVLDRLGVPNRLGIVRSLDGGGVDARRLEGLTPRQREVALALVDGATNAEIAVRLGIGEKAVEKHLGAIYRALGVGGRSAAAAALLGGAAAVSPPGPRSSPRAPAPR